MSDRINKSVELETAPQIDQIELIEFVGRGGMSVVYKAKQLILDRIVAVKLISKSVCDETSLKRLQKEAQLTGSLNHPNIAKTLGFGFSNSNEPYIVMEYLEGHPLSDELKSGVMKFSRFKEIFLPILSALDSAHKAGLIHRDIKPGNIMICKSEDGGEIAKLLDFGIAITVGGAEDPQKLTRTGAILGSPAYMSPEQCMNKDLDSRSDIYSISCVMYEALCGQAPFQSESALELMQHHATSRLPTTAELSRQMEMPTIIAKELLRGLSKSPEKRFQSAHEYREKLSKALDDVTLDRAPRMPRGKKAPDRKLAIASFLTLLCLFITGIAVWEAKKSQKRTIASPSETAQKLLEKAKAITEEGKLFETIALLERAEKINRRNVNRRTERLKIMESLCRSYVSAAYRITDTKRRNAFLNKARKFVDESMPDAINSPDRVFLEAFVTLKIEILCMQSSGGLIRDYARSVITHFEEYHASEAEQLRISNAMAAILINNGLYTEGSEVLAYCEKLLDANSELGKLDGSRWVYEIQKAMILSRDPSTKAEAIKSVRKLADEIRISRNVTFDKHVETWRQLIPVVRNIDGDLLSDLLAKEIAANPEYFDDDHRYTARFFLTTAEQFSFMNMPADELKYLLLAIEQYRRAQSDGQNCSPAELTKVVDRIIKAYRSRNMDSEVAKWEAERKALTEPSR